MMAPIPLVQGALFEVRPALDERLPVDGRLSSGAGPEDVVFLSRSHRGLKAVDAATAEERWAAPLPNAELTRPAASPEDGLVWLSGAGVLAAFDAATGEERGSWDTGARFALQPVAAGGGRALVGNWQGRAVAALEPGREEPAWVAPVGYTSQPVAAAPGRAYVMLMGPGGTGLVQALDAADGHEIWRFSAENGFSAPPAAGPDGTVFAADHGGTVHAVDPATGVARWQVPAAGKVYTTPTPDGHRVYVGSQARTLEAFDALTGDRLWKLDTAGPVRVPATVGADGTICVADESGRALLVEAGSGLPWAGADLGAAPASAPVALSDGSFLVEDRLGRTHRLSRPAPEEAAPGGSIVEAGHEVRIGGVTLPVAWPTG